MPDMQKSCFWHLVAAKLQQQQKIMLHSIKYRSCTLSPARFQHCTSTSSNRIKWTASFMEGSSYFICRSTSFSFASLALPLLELLSSSSLLIRASSSCEEGQLFKDMQILLHTIVLSCPVQETCCVCRLVVFWRWLILFSWWWCDVLWYEIMWLVARWD